LTSVDGVFGKRRVCGGELAQSVRSVVDVGSVEEIREHLRAVVVTDDTGDIGRDSREMIGEVPACLPPERTSCRYGHGRESVCCCLLIKSMCGGAVRGAGVGAQVDVGGDRSPVGGDGAEFVACSAGACGRGWVTTWFWLPGNG
jgi:hypothetical protein